MKNNWFEVDRDGLRQLWEGKPKSWIVRELVANAFDENITACELRTRWVKGVATIEVIDDSPEGFKRLSDAFTLFGSTEKRANAVQRGRFNMGDKQVIAVSEQATIKTTKGTVEFDRNGRHESSRRLDAGSIVTVLVRMRESEYSEMLEIARDFIPPKGIDYTVNDKRVAHPTPLYKFEVQGLATELLVEGQWRRTSRNTELHLYQMDHSDPRAGLLYELGIPVQQITCPYSVDVQQKVPLSSDRESVPESFLKRIYAEVLNVTHGAVKSDSSSEPWIRVGMSTAHVSEDATKSIIKARFGDKVVVAGPGEDPRSIDDAKAEGYTVVHGSQMSAGEWSNVRAAQAIPKAGDLFRYGSVAMATVPTLTPGMERVLRLSKRVGNLCFGIFPEVVFARWTGDIAAQFGAGVLTFNVQKLGEVWFDRPLPILLDLIVHELAHSKGNHTDRAYLDAITRAAGVLVQQAIEDPAFFSEG